MSLVADLRNQLAKKGVDKPEECTGDGLIPLGVEAVTAVSGGFAQMSGPGYTQSAGFGQTFNQTIGNGYTQTTFRQNLS